MSGLLKKDEFEKKEFREVTLTVPMEVDVIMRYEKLELDTELESYFGNIRRGRPTESRTVRPQSATSQIQIFTHCSDFALSRVMRG